MSKRRRKRVWEETDVLAGDLRYYLGRCERDGINPTMKMVREHFGWKREKARRVFTCYRSIAAEKGWRPLIVPHAPPYTYSMGTSPDEVDKYFNHRSKIVASTVKNLDQHAMSTKKYVRLGSLPSVAKVHEMAAALGLSVAEINAMPAADFDAFVGLLTDEAA